MPSIDVTGEPLAQVRAKLIAARDQNLPLEEESDVESPDTQVDDSDDQDVQGATGGAGEDGDDDDRVEDDGEGEAEPQEAGKPASQGREKTPLELAEERFRTVSANNKRLSDEAKLMRDRIAAYERQEREAAEAQQRAEVERKQREFEQAEEWITKNVPAELQESVRRDYRNKVLAGELTEYGKFVEERDQELARREAALQLAQVRAKLPEVTDSIVQYVGQLAEVETDFLSEVTKQEPFQRLLATYESPRDVALIGDLLHAVALVEKGRHRQTLQQNRQRAVEQGAQTKVTSTATAAGGGITNAQFIDRIPKGKDWEEFKQNLRRANGNVAAVRAKMQSA